MFVQSLDSIFNRLDCLNNKIVSRKAFSIRQEESKQMVDVVILNYNDAITTINLVNEIAKYDIISHLLIVDNRSTDDSYTKLKELSSCKVKCIKANHNGGYGYGNNIGIHYLHEHYNSELILLCNPDIHIEEKTIRSMEDFMRITPDCVICAPIMMDVHNQIQDSAFYLLSKWQYILSCDTVIGKIIDMCHKKKNPLHHSDGPYEADVLSGSLFMLDYNLFSSVGMFDEGLFLYGEEVSLGLRIRNTSLKCYLLPDVSFIHEHSVSISKTYKSVISKRRLGLRSKRYIAKKYYGANLSELIAMKVLGGFSYIETWLIVNVLHRVKGI